VIRLKPFQGPKKKNKRTPVLGDLVDYIRSMEDLLEKCNSWVAKDGEYWDSEMSCIRAVIEQARATLAAEEEDQRRRWWREPDW
jgi:hypothetical protein